MAYAPPVYFTPLHKHARRLLERPLTMGEARASEFGVDHWACCWAANVGILLPPTRMGVRVSRPPLVGGLACLRQWKFEGV